METFDINSLDDKRANLYCLSESKEDKIFFKLGSIELSVVQYDLCRHWDFREVGTIFESRSLYRNEYLNNLEYCEPIEVIVKVNYERYDVAFIDPETGGVIAYLNTERSEETHASRYSVFKVNSKPIRDSIQDEEDTLEKRLLR